MDYLTVAEARSRPGLRLVLTARMPGPWGEAAKAVLRLRNVDYLPVAQTPFDANEELMAWTGHRNAPIAVLDDEPPRSGWLDILQLAERLGSGPSLLPADPLDRALALGLSTEICSPDGYGWNRRLAMIAARSDGELGAIERGYGATPEAFARAPGRIAAILAGLTAQLERQAARGSAFLVGDALSACDLYWACFSQMGAPLAQADCPMPDRVRQIYALPGPAIDPRLIDHRDRIFRDHIGLPLEF